MSKKSFQSDFSVEELKYWKTRNTDGAEGNPSGWHVDPNLTVDIKCESIALPTALQNIGAFNSNVKTAFSLRKRRALTPHEKHDLTVLKNGLEKIKSVNDRIRGRRGTEEIMSQLFQEYFEKYKFSVVKSFFP